MALATDIPPRFAAFGALFVEDFNDAAGVTVLDEEDPAELAPAAPPPLPGLDAIRDEAFAAGLRAGFEHTESQRADAVARFVTALREALAGADSSLARHAEEAATALAQALFGALRAALPAVCARFADVEVASLARAILPGLAGVPRIAVHVHPENSPAVAAVLPTLDPELATRVTITSSAHLLPGDLRIGWQDGSAGRDTAALLATIGDELAALGLIDSERSFAMTSAERKQHA